MLYAYAKLGGYGKSWTEAIKHETNISKTHKKHSGMIDRKQFPL